MAMWYKSPKERRIKRKSNWERGREEGRVRVRQWEQERKEGQNLHPDELHFPHYRYKVNTLFPLIYNSIPKLQKYLENSLHLFNHDFMGTEVLQKA